MQDLQHSYPVAKVAKNVNGTTFGEGVSLKRCTMESNQFLRN